MAELAQDTISISLPLYSYLQLQHNISCGIHMHPWIIRIRTCYSNVCMAILQHKRGGACSSFVAAARAGDTLTPASRMNPTTDLLKTCFTPSAPSFFLFRPQWAGRLLKQTERVKVQICPHAKYSHSIRYGLKSCSRLRCEEKPLETALFH